MAGSVPPRRDAYSIGPATISHSPDGSYNDNANSNPTTSYTTMTFHNSNQIPALNQMISVLGGPPQTTHGHMLSPSHTISPTIYSPATPTYVHQSPSTSTPNKPNYALNSPSVAEYPPLFNAGQLHSGWNQQASPRNQVPDLNYANLSMGNYQQNPVNSASSHPMPSPVNALGPNAAAQPGSIAWLADCTRNLSPQQRIEVESAHGVWQSDTERQILVVNMYCDWFESQRRPKKDALLKFYRAKLAPSEENSRVRGGKGGQGARGGAVGYTCEWPRCGKSLGGRTDRVHEHALTHLNIKMFVCDAQKCHASFLRKNELNRHVKSCKLRLPNANAAPTNALFLSMPTSPIASTSRQSNSQPASERPKRQRSLRGVSADISPSTSGNDSPNVSTMTSSFPGFLPQTIPQAHFQSQLQSQMQGPGFRDGQIPYLGHQAPQQQHNTLHHGHTHQNQHPRPQHMMGVNTGDMTPISAYAEQVSTPPGYHGRAFPDPTQ